MRLRSYFATQILPDRQFPNPRRPQTRAMSEPNTLSHNHPTDRDDERACWLFAAELELPCACVPAGTRNHFALDLGVDREDVVEAPDVFVSGGERRVDLAEVNDPVFVNNVSLGRYAEAVQKSGYRNAKLRTLLETVPDALGPATGAPRLRWVEPDGWTTTTFEVRCEVPAPAGIDGEATILDPQLRFRMLPGALRVRIACEHPGDSPSALGPGSVWGTVAVLGNPALVRNTPPAAHQQRTAATGADLKP